MHQLNDFISRTFLTRYRDTDAAQIYWIDNLRGIACLMVVMIHTTTYVAMLIVLAPSHGISPMITTASRVSVPLFFMISGYLFLANAAPSRVISCVSAYACFIAQSRCSTTCAVYLLNIELALKKPAAKPVFYHLWFFFAIAVIYLVSPLIQVKRQRKNVAGANGGDWYHR